MAKQINKAQTTRERMAALQAGRYQLANLNARIPWVISYDLCRGEIYAYSAADSLVRGSRRVLCYVDTGSTADLLAVRNTLEAESQARYAQAMGRK